MRDELLRGLTQEQIEKVRACSKPEDLIKLAADEGVELTEEQLNAITGGACSSTDNHKKRKIES